MYICTSRYGSVWSLGNRSHREASLENAHYLSHSHSHSLSHTHTHSLTLTLFLLFYFIVTRTHKYRYIHIYINTYTGMGIMECLQRAGNVMAYARAVALGMEHGLKETVFFFLHLFPNPLPHPHLSLSLFFSFYHGLVKQP